MGRPLIWHFGLAIISLLAAAAAWKGDFGDGEAEQALFSYPEASLRTMTWTNGKVRLELFSDAKMGLRVKTALDDSNTVAEFPASARAHEVMEKFVRFPIVRRLGKVSPKALVDFGLPSDGNEPSAEQDRLTLDFAGTSHTLVFGGSTYAQNSRYARLDQGDVVLVKSTDISAFAGRGMMLLDRRALPIAQDEIRKVHIRAGGQMRTIIQRFAEDKKRAFMADPAVPEQRLDGIGSWLKQALESRVERPADEKPQGPKALEIEVLGTNKTLGTLSLWGKTDGGALLTSSAFNQVMELGAGTFGRLQEGIDIVFEEGR